MIAANRIEEFAIAPPSPRHIRDPKHWRDRAKEARAIAERFGDPDAIATMLKVAEQYERLAEQAEARQKS